QEDAVDHVAGALVVDDRTRAELGDGEEARPLHELIPTLPAAARRDKRREWQPREAIAGQEAFAREVAVAVEVGLQVALLVVAAEELELSLRLRTQLTRQTALLLR